MDMQSLMEQEEVCPRCFDTKWAVPADWNDEYQCCQWCVDEMLGNDEPETTISSPSDDELMLDDPLAQLDEIEVSEAPFMVPGQPDQAMVYSVMGYHV